MKAFSCFCIFTLFIAVFIYTMSTSSIFAQTNTASPVTQKATTDPETETKTETQTQIESESTTTYTNTKYTTNYHATTETYYEPDEAEDFGETETTSSRHRTIRQNQEDYPVAATALDSIDQISTTTTTTQTLKSTLSTTKASPDSSISSDSPPKILGSGSETSGINTNFIGIIIWCIIGVALTAVLVVLFKSKHSNNHGSIIGKKRYRRSTVKSKAKHLLNDKYYPPKYK